MLDARYTVAAPLAWRSLKGLRDAAHRAAGQEACYGPAPYVGDAGPRKACERAGCVDLYHDVLVTVASKLADATPTNPSAWAARCAEREAFDAGRRARAARGLPAKAVTRSGVTGRVFDALDSQWHRELFGAMRSFAGAAGGSRRWPVEVWAGRRPGASCDDGGFESARAAVEVDIAAVLDVATAVAGRAWVWETMLGPLARRHVGWGNPGDDGAERIEDPAFAEPADHPDELEDLARFCLATATADAANRSDPVAALRRAVDAVFGSDALAAAEPKTLRRAALDLVASAVSASR